MTHQHLTRSHCLFVSLQTYTQIHPPLPSHIADVAFVAVVLRCHHEPIQISPRRILKKVPPGSKQRCNQFGYYWPGCSQKFIAYCSLLIYCVKTHPPHSRHFEMNFMSQKTSKIHHHAWSKPDLIISPDGHPITFAKMGLWPPVKVQYGPYHMGVVGSALTGFWMGLDKRTPLQPFPVLVERFV